MKEGVVALVGWRAPCVTRQLRLSRQVSHQWKHAAGEDAAAALSQTERCSCHDVPAGTKHYGHTSRLTAGSNPHLHGMRFLVYAGRRRAGAVSRGAVGVRVRGKGPLRGMRPAKAETPTPHPCPESHFGDNIISYYARAQWMCEWPGTPP